MGCFGLLEVVISGLTPQPGKLKFRGIRIRCIKDHFCRELLKSTKTISFLFKSIFLDLTSLPHVFAQERPSQQQGWGRVVIFLIVSGYSGRPDLIHTSAWIWFRLALVRMSIRSFIHVRGIYNQTVF